MKVFVTGAAGFLGSHLADSFIGRNDQVVGCDNMIGGDLQNLPEGIEFEVADCNDLPAMKRMMKGVDVIFHTAAIATEGLSVFSPAIIAKHVYENTAGILVGEAGKFEEKVILAKIGRATFHQLVRPGDTLTFSARIEQFSQQGASASGTVTSDGKLVAEIELMFSHIDQNMAGIEFPEHNFVFTEQFTELLKAYRVSAAVTL